MRRLQRPAAVYRDDVAGVLSSTEKRARHAALAVAVRQAHQYDGRSPDNLGGLTSQLTTHSARMFFVQLFESSKKAVTALKDRIRASLGAVLAAECQYCGGLAAPRQLDHFLRKADVPELALYARNLVPCCDACNNLRGATFTDTGDRRILHFYDDNIDDIPELLVATISHRSQVPAVAFSVATSSHPARDLFQRHFDALRLAQRYATKAASQIQQWRELGRGKDVGWFQGVLEAQANARNATFGRNDREATLLRAILASPQTVAWMVAP